MPKGAILNRLEETVSTWPVNGLPATLADRTRRVYDRLAAVYPLSTMFFHSRAHRCALRRSGLRDGMKVLEVATGLGRNVSPPGARQRRGTTVGVDLSPNMAARTQRTARHKFPHAQDPLPGRGCPPHAVPQRSPSTPSSAATCWNCFRRKTSCGTLGEFRRILRDRGQSDAGADRPEHGDIQCGIQGARQSGAGILGPPGGAARSGLIETARFEIVQDRMVRQTFYPSRVLVARK